MDGTLGARQDRAKPRWALVGGLKDESRMYNVSVFDDREVGLRIWKPVLELRKDWRRVEYVRDDMWATLAKRLRGIIGGLFLSEAYSHLTHDTYSTFDFSQVQVQSKMLRTF